MTTTWPKRTSNGVELVPGDPGTSTTVRVRAAVRVPRVALFSYALLFTGGSVTGTAGLPPFDASTVRLIAPAMSTRMMPSFTSAQAPVQRTAETADAAPSERDDVRWIHEASGLTWDQMGRLFGVSRRTVHLWANGSGMNAANSEALYELVALVRSVGGATSAERRVALLRPDEHSQSALDRFRQNRHSAAEPINLPPWRAQDALDLRADLAVQES
jgi:DNA-binding transcriptional regulator YiaG